MFYFLYTLLSYFILPFVFLRLLKKSRLTPAYRKRWSERLGITKFKAKNSIWIHAVSLGEAITAYPLIQKLLQDFPDQEFVITCMTPTGSQFIREKFGDYLKTKKIKHAYLPYDLPMFIKKFLKNTQPKILILIETELWPNLLKYTHENKTKIILANARLSEKSYLNYARFLSLSGEMLSYLDLIIAQTHPDAQRFEALGIEKSKIKITGSLKFDLKIPDNILEKSQELKNKIINFFIH